MRFFIYKSPIGLYRVEYAGDTLTGLVHKQGDVCEICDIDQFVIDVSRQLDEYFAGIRSSFDIAIDYSHCTPFQIKVYSELMKIPYGECRSYKEIATAIGNPNASRAVGMANNRNPIQLIIPCHRVVGSGGKLVGYAGGIDNKEYLLQLERR